MPAWRGSGRPDAIRIGLGYLVGAREEEMATIVAEREARGPYRSLGDLASRAGGGRPSLEVLAWSGACDGLIGTVDRAGAPHRAVAAGHRRARVRGAEGDQLALPLELPEAPALRALDAMGADGRRLRDDRPDRRAASVRAAARRAGRRCASSRDFLTMRHGERGARRPG